MLRLYFDALLTISEEYNRWMSSLRNFLHPPVSHQCVRTAKFTVLYIFISIWDLGVPLRWGPKSLTSGRGDCVPTQYSYHTEDKIFRAKFILPSTSSSMQLWFDNFATMWLTKGFGLVTNLLKVTTNNYDSITELHTLKITVNYSTYTILCLH